MASDADVREICLSLPSATEKPYDGMPAFRVGDRLFARIRAEEEALVVWRTGIADKETLIANEPEKYFQTPHYEKYPLVLVRLDAIDVDDLRNLLTESWTLRAPATVLAKAFGAGTPRSR